MNNLTLNIVEQIFLNVSIYNTLNRLRTVSGFFNKKAINKKYVSYIKIRSHEQNINPKYLYEINKLFRQYLKIIEYSQYNLRISDNLMFDYILPKLKILILCGNYNIHLDAEKLPNLEILYLNNIDDNSDLCIKLCGSFNKLKKINTIYTKLPKLPVIPVIQNLKCCGHMLDEKFDYPFLNRLKIDKLSEGKVLMQFRLENLTKLKLTDVNNIIRIPEKLVNLKILHCNDTTIDYIENLPMLEELYLSESEYYGTKVYYLKNLPKLHTLDIYKASMMTYKNIGPVKYIYLNGVEQDIFKIIDNYESLVNVDISNTNTTFIPYLKHLKILRCRNIYIKEIPNFPELTVLDCSHTKIKKIPEFKNLTSLICEGTKIKLDCRLPKLTNLSMSNCKNIKDIRHLDKICRLEANDSNLLLFSTANIISLCIKNTKIEYIPYMKHLRYLYVNEKNIKYIHPFIKKFKLQQNIYAYRDEHIDITSIMI